MPSDRSGRAPLPIGPSGQPLTLEDLPPADTVRWVIRRKAELVAAIRGGLLSLTVRIGLADPAANGAFQHDPSLADDDAGRTCQALALVAANLPQHGVHLGFPRRHLLLSDDGGALGQSRPLGGRLCIKRSYIIIHTSKNIQIEARLATAAMSHKLSSSRIVRLNR